MKKLLLISTYEDIATIGIRYISSYLKSNNIDVRIIHIISTLSKNRKYTNTGDREKNIQLLLTNIKEYSPDYIGIGVMTNYFKRVAAIAIRIKKNYNIPIIFGGIHPTICPDECLEVCDIVCIGEAEDTILDICNGKSLKKIEGIAYKENGTNIKNPLRNFEEDLDSYPFPDWSLNDEHLIHENTIIKVDKQNIVQYLHTDPFNNIIHRIMTSRGCPFSCTYCCNHTLKKIFKGKGKYLRSRSVENVIDEMVDIKKNLNIKSFRIMDDSFLFYDIAWFKNFSEQYKEKVNLPLSCLSSPLNAHKEKLKLLVHCGLNHIQLGLQTGSDRINFELYERRISSKVFLDTMNMISTLRPIPKVTLDIIFDNPMEKKDDKLRTLKLLKKIKIPFKIGAFALTYYPKTKLFEIAEQNHILDKATKEKIYTTSYHDIEQNEINLNIMSQGSSWEQVEERLKTMNQVFCERRDK